MERNLRSDFLRAWIINMLKVPTSARSLCIAIVVRDDRAGLQSLLESLTQSFRSASLAWPILVVDNSSESMDFHDFLLQLPFLFPNLDLQVVKRNFNSMSEARQQALELSKTDWLAFLDSDCQVPSAWATNLQDLLTHYQHDKTVWALGGLSLLTGNTLSARTTRVLAQAFAAHRSGQSSEDRSVSHLPSSHLILRTAAILKIGGFPKNFHLVGEDIALSLMIRAWGGKLVLRTKLYLHHHQVGNLLTQLKRFHRYGRAQGTLLWSHPRHLLSTQMAPLYILMAGFLSFANFPAIGIDEFVLLSLGLAIFSVMLLRTRLVAPDFFPKDLLLIPVVGIGATFSYATGILRGFLLRDARWTAPINDTNLPTTKKDTNIPAPQSPTSFHTEDRLFIK